MEKNYISTKSGKHITIQASTDGWTIIIDDSQSIHKDNIAHVQDNFWIAYQTAIWMEACKLIEYTDKSKRGK